MKSFAGLFLCFALYTPFLWYVSNLTTKYGSIDSAPALASIFAIFLVLMPLVVIYFIDKAYKK